MTPPILLVTFAIFTINCVGQTTLNGTYLDDRDELSFHDDSVSFSIMSNGGVIFPIEGSGGYKLTDDLLIIQTGNNSNKPSTAKKPRELGDTLYSDYQTFVFKFNTLSDEQLDLVLIGVCASNEFKGHKTIKRFKQNHRKLIFRQRLLKKKN